MKIAAVILLVFFAAAPSWAVLGQRVQSVHSDQQRMRGQLRSVSRQGYTVQQITSPGGVVNEYVSPDGIVFGVSWQGLTVPNLSQLLGSYFKQFQQAARSSAKRRHAVVFRTDQLVVESGGHMRGFRGRAYVPALIPRNVSPSVVQ